MKEKGFLFKIINSFAEKVAPKLYVHSVSDIDFEKLKKIGIEGIVLDLDNTILPWKDYNVPPISLNWVNEGKKQGMKFFILSNTIHTKRLAHISETLKCDYIHPAFKPQPINYYRAAKKLKISPKNMACVGDQLFTDIKGGNKAGFYTILVDQIDQKEFKGTKISRFFEKIIKKYIKSIDLIL